MHVNSEMMTIIGRYLDELLGELRRAHSGDEPAHKHVARGTEEVEQPLHAAGVLVRVLRTDLKVAPKHVGQRHGVRRPLRVVIEELAKRWGFKREKRKRKRGKEEERKRGREG